MKKSEQTMLMIVALVREDPKTVEEMGGAMACLRRAHDLLRPESRKDKAHEERWLRVKTTFEKMSAQYEGQELPPFPQRVPLTDDMT